jgi:NADH-ubiquinone oxidoreductase chain 4
MLPILSEGTLLFTPLVYIICLLTIIYISLITIIQIDLKIIIAYSSISHMALCILGIFSNNIIGIDGSYLLSIAHGLVSPGLFIAIGGVLYDRYHTRILIYYNGLLSIMPLFSLYFIILSFANIGTPLSANFIGEFLSSLGAFKTSPIITTICSFAILLSATYQFKLTNRITGGTNYYIYNIGDVTKRESFMFIIIIIPTLIIGIYPQPIINNLSFIISSTIYN